MYAWYRIGIINAKYLLAYLMEIVCITIKLTSVPDLAGGLN